MKRKYDLMRYADDKYIEEANPERKVRKRSRLTVLIAAVLSLALLVGALSVFLLPANKKDEYNRPQGYLAIQSGITTYLESHGKYTRKNQTSQGGFWDNLFNMFGGAKGEAMDNAMNGAAMDGDIYYGQVEEEDIVADFLETYNPSEIAPTPDGTAGNKDNSSVEVTDNQVEGVSEGDRFKRSHTHIFYLDVYGVLKVYTIEGLNSRTVNSLNVGADVEYKCAVSEKVCNVTVKEMFLSSDAKTLTLIVTFNSVEDSTLYTGIINYDVSDPENIQNRAIVTMSGDYLSARFIDGKLLVMSSQTINEEALYENGKVSFGEEETYLPCISEANGELKVFDEEDIIIPENTSRLCYTNVTVLDGMTLESLGEKAMFSHSTDAYVTRDRIYLTSVWAKMTEKSSSTVRDAMTDITCLKIGDGELTEEGVVTVRGYVKDQYSMDEYEGILRVVTTTNSTEYHNSNYVSYGYDDRFSIATATGRSNASLYCIDATSFEVVSEVVDFAPPHEEVQSARFDKTMAYVCTSIEMSDPVFFFDLSDINNITYKDTGTIEGYSTSLVNLQDGFLLGFGVANWSDTKIEVYRESENGVESFSDYIIRNSNISHDHKAHYINREGLIGFGVNKHNGSGKCEYILLGFSEEKGLFKILSADVGYDTDSIRATLIDGYFYILHSDGLTVNQLY